MYKMIHCDFQHTFLAMMHSALDGGALRGWDLGSNEALGSNAALGSSGCDS